MATQAQAALRRKTGIWLATALNKSADAAQDFIRARVACDDDPRAGRADDGVVLLRDAMREIAGHLEDTLSRSA